METLVETRTKQIEKNNTIKICAMSDLHGYLPESINPVDLVIICGDLVPLDCQGSSSATKKWYIKIFKSWAENLPCDKVIFIAGNHELHFRQDKLWVQEQFNKFQKVTYLENEYYVYNGLRLFGTPYCKIFGKWAFMHDDSVLSLLFAKIPKNIDILITHDAPFGCSDILLEELHSYRIKNNLGNVPLRNAILEKNPKYNLHGHLHSSNHKEELLGNTKVMNCSLLTEEYQPYYYPIYLELTI